MLKYKTKCYILGLAREKKLEMEVSPMGKSITFVDKDAQLIKKIVAYQKERGISSFVETVRQLCEKALKFSEITK